MDAKYLIYLYQQYQAGNLNEDEMRQWQQAIADMSKDDELLSLIDSDWHREDFVGAELSADDKESIYKYVISHPQQQQPFKRYRIWSRLSVAVAISAIILSVGIWIYTSDQKQKNINVVAHNHDVVPGKKGATLTLANGTKIRLTDASNGELANQAGVTITKTEDGQLVYQINESKDSGSALNALNTLSTANGETYQLRLPDGSMVWLNAASSLTYPTKLNQDGKRRVKLNGEGYFEIAKDKAHPFIVKTEKQEVEVLGTHFNINAYQDEQETKTTLLEGAVKVSTLNSLQFLKSGQQAILSGSRLNVISTEAAQDVIAWTNGAFVFDNKSLKEIMRQISRWYDVEVSYQGNIADPGFGGSISRSKRIEEVLKALEKTQGVHFKINGRRILVMP